MWQRKLLLGALVSTTLAGMALPVMADVDFFVSVAPPAPRYEVVPTPRSGYVWAPGYWDWRSNRHVWIKGHWERERAGYYYHPPRWEERDGRWRLNRGAWDRNRGDRDHDGVPNYRDRDRDGDGVPNYRDNAPNNPRRY